MDTKDLGSLLSEVNIASKLDKDDLDPIGPQVINDFEDDLDSRKHWEEQYEQWMKLAIQVMEDKTWPWFNASNVKYPLLATAAMQFQARSYPTLVGSPAVVKARVWGEDPDGSKQLRAERISKHMSYQVLEEMENWDEDMDKACFVLPIVGTVFKKVYWCKDEQVNKSELVLPKDLVINYWAKSIEEATTKTHILYMTRNTVREKQLSGEFLDFDLKTAAPKHFDFEENSRQNENLAMPSDNDSAPLTILEQHRWLDLDEDDYQEPYIVTVEYSTGKVLRITPRFEADGIKLGAKGEIIKIIPEEYFIKFSFIPNPDGGFYDLGFGALLGPLNETVNTLINQLIDSGTLNNLQSGFIAKGIRMKLGEGTMTPGEWRTVQTTGDDLRKGIMPLPTKEPSETLFKLLGTIVESGQKLASVAEIFVGKMPGQNTPATTTMATIEQGMKVFTAIYKRIYRSLTKEFKRLYRLNKIYMSMQDEFRVVDSQQLMQIGQSDYQQDDTDVRPAADPTMVSEQLRLTKAQALLEMIPLGTINAQEATKRVLEAMEQPEIEKLMSNIPQPPPDPKLLQVQAKMQQDQQKTQLKEQEMQLKAAIEAAQAKQDAQAQQMELHFKALSNQLEAAFKEKMHYIDLAKSISDMQAERVKHQQDIQSQADKHAQDMKQVNEKHQQDIKLKKKKITMLNDKEATVEEV